jgi:very-short-patch-repair endonuclease
MATTSAPSPGPAARADGPSVDARITAAADQWRRRLLDLTKRNRALNFRPTKVSTVAVVDEHPAEIFRRLVVREAAMRFKAAPERAERADASASAPTPGATTTATDALAPEDDEAELPAQDFAPYDPAVLNERHTDDWLQTALTPDALDRSLRRLDEQARLAIEEQGVNTLFLGLGMLHYVESEDSAQTFRAPLVLVPVQLTRTSARAGYALRATGDDPLVNPALAELLRRDHALPLPELPDGASLGDDYDLQAFLGEVATRVAERAGWSVKTDVVLALFSFQKFVMFKDLETNAAAIGRHRLIGRLVTRLGDDGEHLVGLPDDVRTMDLDAEYPPERTFQVVDADASQLRAIAAVARRHDLVIEGPPGTGKSQTITNLIAQALAAGQSVLFVAEKMAALSVVHARLVEAGFGEFCLELHSTKANKRAVMQALGAAMDASLQPVSAPTASTERLPIVRATLTDYVRALHAPRGALGVSPYRAYGEVGRVLAAPRVAYAGPIDGVTMAQLEQAVRDLEDLATAGAAIGVPDRHPWRDSARTFYTGDDVDAARELARTLVARMEETAGAAARVQAALQLPPVATFADVRATAAVADVLRRSPGAPLGVLESDAWNAPPPEAMRLIEQGRQLVVLRDRLLAQLAPEALERDHADDAAYVERKAQGVLSFLAFLDGRHRAIKKRWLAYRRAGWAPSLVDQVEVMRQVDRLRAERAALAAAEPSARALFGGAWAGEASDWEALAQYVRWVVEFRGTCVRHGLTGRAIEAATRAAPDVSAVDALLADARQAEDALARLRGFVEWPADHLAPAPFAEIAARAAALADAAREAPRWAVYEGARCAVDAGIARGMLPLARSGELPFDALVPAFRRAFWLAWLNAVLRERPALERFATLTHEARIAEFRELDRRVLHENRAALVNQLRERVQQRLREPEAAAGLPVLRREIARQRGHAPLRRTLTQADAAVRAIKPCWMMSPLTAAQYVPGDRPTFDLVIFDEASQLPVEDAVGAVSRGARLVVVGDPKQLPPTNFFAASLGQADVARAEDGSPIYEDSESILEEFMGAGVPMSRLKWHYRSAHESLIHFSNVSFYDAELHTFPSVETASAASGLQFRHVAEGVYEGKGLNLAEARAVSDEIVRFAHEQLARRAAGARARSLGVGTFNLRQQLAIQDELEQRRRDDPALEAFFDRSVPEPFFVKNLENIQGDERDVIFLSVTYAKGADGRLRQNFGPLNGENGWRRLNVLTTRARQRMVVFSSMRGEEISAAPTTSRGAQLLREFLNYAERGRLESATASRAADTESPFERDVLQALTERGLTLVPQVGVAGYRVDLGVLDESAPGRFLCGIECDGASYHASETARDRDRLRQQVLEARGWTIHRVWSTDWFKDRSGQVERLLALVEDARRRAREVRDAEQEARARGVAAEAQRAVAAESERHEEAAAIAAVASVPYVRPVGSPYAVAPVEDRFAGSDLLAAPESQLVAVLREIVATEAPIHEADLVSRTAAAWGSRVGSRIQARILDACRLAERTGLVRRRGAFLWGSEDHVVARSRATVRTPAERIAPEEYASAIRAVLASGHAFSRAQLATEVRALLGYARIGAVLDEAIGAALDGLLAAGAVGEGSAGVRLRRAGSQDAVARG